MEFCASCGVIDIPLSICWCGAPECPWEDDAKKYCNECGTCPIGYDFIRYDCLEKCYKCESEFVPKNTLSTMSN
jgi:hypothetical protein